MPPLLYHHHSQEHFFNCNITGLPYVEMLLINMIKLLFVFFLSDYNVRCWFLQSLEALTTRDFYTQKYFNCLNLYFNIFIPLSVLLSSSVMFFLHSMLNILRYDKTFCEIDEWIASQPVPPSDVIFWVLIMTTFFLLRSVFFYPENCFLRSSCHLLIAESIIDT